MVSNKCCVRGCSQIAAFKFDDSKDAYDVLKIIIGCSLNKNSRVCVNSFKPNDVYQHKSLIIGSSQISVFPIKIIRV